MSTIIEALTSVFSNSAGTVLTHPAGYAVLRYSNGRWPVTTQAELLTYFGQTLLDHDWHICLNDARQLQALPAEHRNWVTTNWVQTARLRPKPLLMAWLHPAELISRLTVQQMQAHHTDQLQYAYFTEDSAAHAYIQSQLALRSSTSAAR